MSETLNNRIRKLRKEKGFTQLQLAEMLNITDKAVSKWELGEGNPDIGLLPKISQIFGVTVDYLLTGNMTNNIVLLEDMDNTKRAIYLVQKDDLENFIKFEYNMINPLLNPYENLLKQNMKLTPLQEQIREEIYKVEAVNIFQYLLDDLISNKKYSQYLNRINGPKIAAALVYNDLDNFIKMCAITNRVDGLEFISIVRLAIGEKSKQQSLHTYHIDPTQTYLIQESILRLFFEDARVSNETIDYISKLHFYEKQPGVRAKAYYFLNDYLLYLMYHYKKDNLLRNAYSDLVNYLDNAIEIYPNVVDNYNGRNRTVFKHKLGNQKTYYSLGNCSTGNTRDQDVTHIIEPIKKALDEAIENLDIEWIELFNDYNRKISECFSKSQIYLDEKKVEMLRMKANPNVADEEVLVYKFTKSSLLDVKGLLSSIVTDPNDVKSLRANLIQAKDLYINFITQSYIHYCEMIEDLISEKDYKRIFEFSVDNDLAELMDALVNRKHESIMQVARKLFYLDSATKNSSLNASRIRRSNNPTDELINILLRSNPSHRKNEKYIDLLKNQYNCSDIDMSETDTFKIACSKVKKEIYNNFVSDIDLKIEKITGEKKAKLEYEKVCEEITENYLYTLINDDKLETAVIKICVKLEAKLKYIYKYEGEFKVMLDSYIHNNLKLENLWDDEDNNYYASKQNDANKEEITKLLNRLRMVRNSIVHSTSQQEMLTKQELEQIVKVIEKI
ncbi:MAG: helix-turn-helix transcriptional regulator [Acholeplasmatales bacterium]|nr:helix-turn-helix transcriptional regulator [Acholeplasmatales bacterium]